MMQAQSRQVPQLAMSCPVRYECRLQQSRSAVSWRPGLSLPVPPQLPPGPSSASGVHIPAARSCDSPPWVPAPLLPGSQLLSSLGSSSSPPMRCCLMPGQARCLSAPQISDRHGRSLESFTLGPPPFFSIPELYLMPVAIPGHHTSPHAWCRRGSETVGSVMSMQGHWRHTAVP